MANFAVENLALVKLETNYGVDAVPTANDAILCTEPVIPEMRGEVITESLVRPFMGGQRQMVVGEHYAVNFKVEVNGSGVAGTAPRYGPLLQASRHALTTVATTSNTYSEISTIGAASTSVTCYIWYNGSRHAVTGWRGSSVTFELVNNDKGYFTFQGIGIYAGPVTAALPTYTFSTTAPLALPVTLGNTLNINIAGHSAGDLQSFRVTLTNDTIYNSRPGGAKEVLITGMQTTTFEAVYGAPLQSVFDPFAAALTNTTGALSVTHGTTNGNRVAFAAARAKTLIPSYENDNGVVMMRVPGILLPSTTGNDGHTFAFT
jgi:hypothetical protein